MNNRKAEMPLLPDIRNTVRAVILQGDNILLLKKVDEDGSTCFALPGGGQVVGETLEVALLRECLEEIGVQVQIDKLLKVVDFFKVKSQNPPIQRHLVDFLFLCRIDKSYNPQNGPVPDKHQVAVQWVALDALRELTFTPGYLSDYLGNFDLKTNGAHLGACYDVSPAKNYSG
ncbi:MAG: NUDIX domain-containing protein [Pseudomonadales bacterium]|nr:NUDIX domain-containing protein [Pseudomonadales bacterium]